MSPPPLLAVRSLSHAYGDRRVLDRVTLEVAPHEWVGLVGVNGAGKSTLLRCVAGLLGTTANTILHSGVDLARRPVEAKRRFGYAVEPTALPDELTLDQFLEVVTSAHDRTGLGDTATMLYRGFRLADYGGAPLSRCSLGTRQKAGIVAAFAGEPALVVLDEPFNGLDAESQLVARKAFAAFAGKGGGVLMASHTIEVVAQWCTRLVRLAGGRIDASVDLQGWRADGRQAEDLWRWLLARASEADDLSDAVT